MITVMIDSMDGPLYCPFCAALLVDEGFQDPCPHTLFMCVEDGGVEYCAPELDADELEEKIDSEGMDEATDNINVKNAIKFALYEGAPSNAAVYVGVKTDVPSKK